MQRLSNLETLLSFQQWHPQFSSPSYHMPPYFPMQFQHSLPSYSQATPTPLQTTPTPLRSTPTPLRANSSHQQPHSSSQAEKSSGVGPLRLGNINTANSLPSSSIQKDKLATIEDVLEKYPQLRGESKAGSLACKLAKEAIFGKEVLKLCTPSGNRELPALPYDELFELKKAMFMQFPQYWRSPPEFEPVWKRCLDAIQQACKRMRLDKN